MKTYQDYLAVRDNPQDLEQFILATIKEHKSSDLYEDAVVADEYFRKQNRTIMRYKKLLYTLSGQAVPDNYSANWKICSGFFGRFVKQEVQHLLGNGATWEDSTKEQIEAVLGTDFDTRLQELGKEALKGGVAFAFFNLDHIEVFPVTQFAPLYDEENGALMVGMRFWQVDDNKPLRVTLYELEGYTDYIFEEGKATIIDNAFRKPYISITETSEAEGTKIYKGENLESFPIVPLWGNPEHQSELIGLREGIDCYDLIKSGFANDLDDVSQIYWILQNAQGMDDIDVVKFIERLKTTKAAKVDDANAHAEAHTVDVPYASRDSLLNRIERDLYKDAMAFDHDQIVAGATTATQIKAAYEPLNTKCDDFEYCIDDFIKALFNVAGLDEQKPPFTRSGVNNSMEEIQVVLSASSALTPDYVTRKILNILGDGDMADTIINALNAINMKRMTGIEATPNEEET